DTSIAGHRWTPSPETGSGTSAHKTMRNALRNSSEGPYFRCRVTEHRQRASRQVRNPDNTGMVSGGHHTGRGQLHHQQQKQRVSAGFSCVFFFWRGLRRSVAFVAGAGAVSVCWRTWQEKQRQATTRAAPVATQGDGQGHRWQPCMLANLPLVARDAPTTTPGKPGNTQK